LHQQYRVFAQIGVTHGQCGSRRDGPSPKRDATLSEEVSVFLVSHLQFPFWRLIDPSCGTGIKVVHLDEIPAGSVQEKQLFQDLDNLPPSPEKTLLLFSSPQRISDSKSWTKELPRMIHAEVLKMVCVDEAHLYVMHGLYFRPKFFKLKEILFDKMKNSNIPVMFMTATATKDMIGHIKQLSGLDIIY
jgi:hypothetical protein